MDNLLNEIKEKNRMMIFSVIGFLMLTFLADMIDIPRSYSTTVLKGNRTYFDNFKEAFFMRDRGMDPYEESVYFSQNYFLFIALNYLRNYPIILKGLRIFFILSAAALIGQIIGGSRKHKTIITSLILLNPVTVN